MTGRSRGLGIRTTLLAGVAVMTLAALGAGLAGYRAAAVASQHLVTTSDRHLLAIDRLLRAKAGLDARADGSVAAPARVVSVKSTLEGEASRLFAEVDVALDRLARTLREDLAAGVRSFRSAWREFRLLEARQSSSRLAPDRAPDARAVPAVVQTSRDRALPREAFKLMEEAIAEIREDVQQARREGERGARQATVAFVGVSILAAALGGVVAWSADRRVARPLAELAAERAAPGGAAAEHGIGGRQQQEGPRLATPEATEAGTVREDRLGALEEMVSRATHELNNRLAVALGHVDLLRATDSSSHPGLEGVRQAITAGGEAVRRLQACAFGARAAAENARPTVSAGERLEDFPPRLGGERSPSPPVPRAGPAVATLPRRPTAASILVVDDDPLVAELLALALRQAGHHVELAPSGAVGIERHGQGRFDCVITDMAMPDGSGLTVCRAVKERDPAVRVVLLTGGAEDVDPVAVVSAGVDRVLSKPVSLEDLARLFDADSPHVRPSLREAPCQPS